jgi:hypothetical protein
MLGVWHGTDNVHRRTGYWIADDNRRLLNLRSGKWLPFAREIDCRIACRSLMDAGYHSVQDCLSAGHKVIRPIIFRDLQW